MTNSKEYDWIENKEGLEKPVEGKIVWTKLKDGFEYPMEWYDRKWWVTRKRKAKKSEQPTHWRYGWMDTYPEGVPSGLTGKEVDTYLSKR